MTDILDQKDFKRIKKVLDKGGVFIYPTETSYGIGCNALDEKAIKKIYSVKKRSEKKGLIVLVSDLKMAEKYIRINDTARKLCKRFMPGPLTLVCDNKRIPKPANTDEVSFRISSSEFVTEFLKYYKKPIKSTSANISGKDPIYSFENVVKEFYGKVDIIIEAGKLEKNKLSTVFDTRSLKVLRKGAVSSKEISGVLRTP